MLNISITVLFFNFCFSRSSYTFQLGTANTLNFTRLARIALEMEIYSVKSKPKIIIWYSWLLPLVSKSCLCVLSTNYAA